MGFKTTLGLIFIILALALLISYWFVPLSTIEFYQSQSSQFTISEPSKAMQFYGNMRFSDSQISYKIGQCSLGKRDEMIRAFSFLEEKTTLTFYPVKDNEEISIECDSEAKLEGGLFIAGEGGPTNITKSGEFNVISKGNILLLRESNCQGPNVALHELIHVLGFDHVSDPKDIMFAISKCDQELSQSTIDTINSIYYIPSNPDLLFEGASAVMHGKYLDVNVSIRNAGLKPSPLSTILIYVGESSVKEIYLDPLEVGNGRQIFLTNIWVPKLSVDEISFLIESPSDELKKENNKVVLEIKK